MDSDSIESPGDDRMLHQKAPFPIDRVVDTSNPESDHQAQKHVQAPGFAGREAGFRVNRAPSNSTTLG